jgi:hypothetical protein
MMMTRNRSRIAAIAEASALPKTNATHDKPKARGPMVPKETNLMANKSTAKGSVLSDPTTDDAGAVISASSKRKAEDEHDDNQPSEDSDDPDSKLATLKRLKLQTPREMEIFARELAQEVAELADPMAKIFSRKKLQAFTAAKDSKTKAMLVSILPQGHGLIPLLVSNAIPSNLPS